MEATSHCAKTSSPCDSWITDPGNTVTPNSSRIPGQRCWSMRWPVGNGWYGVRRRHRGPHQHPDHRRDRTTHCKTAHRRDGVSSPADGDERLNPALIRVESGTKPGEAATAIAAPAQRLSRQQTVCAVKRDDHSRLRCPVSPGHQSTGGSGSWPVETGNPIPPPVPSITVVTRVRRLPGSRDSSMLGARAAPTVGQAVRRSARASGRSRQKADPVIAAPSAISGTML